MNGISGFREVRSSTSRSRSDEQRHQFITGSLHLLRTRDLIALFTGITKQEKVPDTFLTSTSLYVCAVRLVSCTELSKEPAMNGTSGFQEVRSSTSRHPRIGCCTSNGINLEQVPGTIFMLQLTNNSLAFFAYYGGRDETY